LHRLYGVRPAMVFDRGFVNQKLIQFMTDEKWVFYIRMREDFKVVHRREKVRVGSLPRGSYTVHFAGRKLRIVVTKTRHRYKNPWYIITNDTQTKPSKIARFYYHRFQIEECFRDIKTLFRVRHMRLSTWQSLRTILCFMSLGIILALADKYTTQIWEAQKDTQTERKQLGIIRIWQEHLEQCFSLNGIPRIIWGGGGKRGCVGGSGIHLVSATANCLVTIGVNRVLVAWSLELNTVYISCRAIKNITCDREPL
jgi:hypothetical protein